MDDYATKAQMIEAYSERALIELTDHTDTGEIDDAVLGRALADASSLIDSYISRRYDPAMARTADVLRAQAMTIAYFKLHRANWPDEVRTAYEDAIEFLRAVSTGTANLNAGAAQPASTPADARVEARERLFSRESLKGL